MKTMTIRQIRQQWPEAERQLAVEKEIVITRDGKPVARLLPVEEVEPVERKRFDPEAHMKWLEETFPEGTDFDLQKGLQEDREERKLV